jgi:DNA-binding HxlR family transcriptional regulator
VPAVIARPGSPAQPNAIGRALQLLGDRWTLLILRNMFFSRQRQFGELRDSLGISDSVLTSRLDALVADDVLERGERVGRHVDYRLTQRGLDVWRILVAVWAWERRWVPARPDDLPVLVHEQCGKPTEPILSCGGCETPTGARDLDTTLGPSGRLDLAAPPRHRRRSSRPERGVGATALFPDTLAIMGDRWSAVVFAAALLGTRRFSDFQRELGVSPTLLSGRLRSLETIGALAREGRGEYRLTDKGLAFFPVVAMLVDWAERWFGDPAQVTISFRHRPCGAVWRPGLRCDPCGEPLERGELRWT